MQRRAAEQVKKSQRQAAAQAKMMLRRPAARLQIGAGKRA
jgi:hypothetical protein